MKNGNGTVKIQTWFWLVIFSFFFILMLNITLHYIPFDATASFLQIKQTEVTTISGYLPIFYIHVYSAIFALLAGFTQFNSRILKKYPKTHRAIGQIYVYTVLFLAAPSGIYIGYYANGGLLAKISFMLLGTLWYTFTVIGLISAKKRFILRHKNFMLRSFALAFSAITLRLWKVILVFAFHPNPMEVYKIIAWLGWVPNIILIEWYIYKKQKK
ncbi:MAG: DUF2306 domain-containing protein [Flavobacterium sp.]|nr:DUF2306 domain-containing protein [Flavobacterium sp.]